MNFMMIVWILIMCLGINYIFFIITLIIKKDLLIDVAYCLTFAIVATVLVAWKQNMYSIYQLLIYILVMMWAFRLGIYFLVRIIKIKTDDRHNFIRGNFWKGLLFWNFRAIAAFVIGLPAFFALTLSSYSFFNQQDIMVTIFLVIALSGLVIETVADFTKFTMHLKTKKTDDFKVDSIWKYSRHPNYLGEIIFWFSILVIFWWGYFENNSIKINNHALNLLWIFSPILLVIMLVYLTGIPVLEMNSYKKYGKNEKYNDYVAKVPILIPFIGSKGHIYRVKKLIIENKIKDSKKPNKTKTEVNNKDKTIITEDQDPTITL